MHATFHGFGASDHKQLYGFHDASNNTNQFLNYRRLKNTNQVPTYVPCVLTDQRFFGGDGLAVQQH
jgi:hypothetical protein